MKVTISALGDPSPDGARVSFACAVGSAVGLWNGPSPHVGSSYDVELEAPGLLLWGDDLRLCRGCEDDTITQLDEGGVLVQGAVIALEDDGTVVLRVGDGLLMLDTAGDPERGVTRVQARVPELRLYDTRL